MNPSEAASLTSVKLRRGKRPAVSSTKPGDITAKLLGLDDSGKAARTAPRAEASTPKRADVTFFLPTAADIIEPPASTPRAPDLELAPIATQPRGYWEFIDYWDRLRRGRRPPILAALDRSIVAECWPDSLMVTYTAVDTAMPQIVRLGRPTGAIEYTPMVTEWIIACARQVAHDGEAMEDEQEFPVANGMAGYRLLLLPFANDNGRSDYVVCHLSRAQGDRTPRR
jgi:hypothetical protein